MNRMYWKITRRIISKRKKRREREKIIIIIVIINGCDSKVYIERLSKFENEAKFNK